MQVSRRWITLAGGAAFLSACGGPGARPGLPAADPALQPVANPGWDAWVAAFRPRARDAGIPEAALAAGFGTAGYLPGVVERDRAQTEFTRTLEDYLAIVANEEKVAEGRRRARAQAGLLSEIEARYGVPAEVVAAVWGMESNYGTRRGDIPVVSATSTLAYDGRRGAFFESQLLAALRILARGDTSAPRLVGSWAGAMGHTQFIPTTYQSYAVDFRGDGRRDIWSEDPTDGLASAAAYLSASGWRRGEPWGQEITASDPGQGGTVIAPQPGGPRFRVYRNFDVIKRYNNSTNYAIGVGHLSDRIAGAGPLRGGFPPDRYGLTRADRQLLQRRLSARGFDAGTPDGVIGSRTEEAISAYQRSAGLPVTGTPSTDLLARLR
ncbi:Membrane-bound lytic murein transglycosylase B precursor [Roseivivax jejudonensis]|uniref:Membrane-bound lytic murein transglycosylase B n=1 Tax=Roseivivax jejudonensis TaxID=1529041 RepID=A0A1X6YMT9_9RHOB|nr:lytic murein transglycosylase [Roseivivax jejudonensis]SLN24159.1 Membrane-bound lytic murein transglycosylase B precursor [Roseivivax jejudonensis]